MKREKTIGIIGGYGETGTIIAAELARTNRCKIVIGGRNLKRAEKLARALGEDTHARQVDVFDPKSLREFCDPCGIVVNCSGPGFRVFDRPAMAALACDSHYVDPSNPHGLHAELSRYHSRMAERGRAFLLSVGYSPGIAEMLLRHVDVLASQQLEIVKTLSLYVMDRNEWSLPSFEAIVERFCFNASEIGRFRRGVWRAESFLRAREKYRFPEPFGEQSVVPYFSPELKPFAEERKDRDVAFYVPMGMQCLALRALIRALFAKRKAKAAAMLRSIFRLQAQLYGGGGVLVAVARGILEGRDWQVIGRLTVGAHEHYWVSAVAAVVAVRMIMEKRIRVSGCHYLSDAVEPGSFMGELASLGVKCEVTAETC